MITSFSGTHRFLSNFFPSPIKWRGKYWATVEHAYQAAKAEDVKEAEDIRRAKTPGKAKRLGRQIKIRSDWDKIKLQIMEELVEAKFTSNPKLADLLIKTGDQKLIEGNNWNDTFWGVCRGKGRNELGRILMRIREKLIHNEK